MWNELANAPPAGTELCRLDDVPEGGARLFRFGVEQAFRLIVLRSGDEVFAYVNRCAHFGVPLVQEGGNLLLKPHVSFSCNVHYARYRWRDGYCEWGDCAGESLLTVPVEVVAGSVRIGSAPVLTIP